MPNKENVHSGKPDAAHNLVRRLRSIGRAGEIGEDTFLSLQPVSQGKRIVEFVAVWGAASRLAGESTVRCVVLSQNPLRKEGNDVVLRVDEEHPAGEIELGNGKRLRRTEISFKEGAGAVLERGDPRDLSMVDTVLTNIQNSVLPLR